MKKHLIAAAVAAAVAVPAAAQVTVSGTLDIPFYASENHTTGANTVTKTRSVAAGRNLVVDANSLGKWSTSTINFSGSEDLGGGLKASFFVNQTIDSQSGLLAARDRYLDLAGGFGSVRFGRFSPTFEGQYTNYAVSGTTNSAGTSDSAGSDLVAGTLGTTQDTGTAGRQAGVLQYTSPSFSGMTLTAAIVEHSADANATAGKAETSGQAVTANFVAGPLSLGVGYANFEGSLVDDAAPDRADNEILHVGASYNFGMATVRYAYDTREGQTTANTLTTAMATVKDISLHNIGVSIPMGSAVLFGSLYDGEDKVGNGVADDMDLEGYQVGLRYNLSKRTFAYVVTGQNKETAKAAANVANNWKNTQTNLGLVHSF